MMILDWLTWWYGAAWMQALQRVQKRAVGVLDTFSVTLLAGSLFAPFRQIDAGGVRGPIGVQIRAWFDRSFSRIFGFFLRSIMILTGLTIACFVWLFGVVWLLTWLVIPVLPVLGIIATGSGWVLS